MLLGWRPSPRWRKEEGRGKRERGSILVLVLVLVTRRTEKGARTTPLLLLTCNLNLHAGESSILWAHYSTLYNYFLRSFHLRLRFCSYHSFLRCLLPILPPSVCLLLHLHSDCVRLPSSALGCSSSTAGPRPPLRFTRQTDCISFHRAV